jgi:hypothetical protein
MDVALQATMSNAITAVGCDQKKISAARFASNWRPVRLKELRRNAAEMRPFITTESV